MELEGKTAIVTGGGQGIGRGVALVLARRGAAVTVTGRTKDKLDLVVKEIEGAGGRALAVVGDVGRRDDVDAMVDDTVNTFGGINILINNAQSSKPGISVADLSDEDFELVFRSGALGTLFAMQACYPYLKAAGGCVINFGSSTSITGDAGFASYVMAKEAIRGLSRVAAREWGRDGIRVNVVCPAAHSPSADKFRDSDPERFARIVRQIPLGRMGDEVEDIGRAVAALVSDDFQYLTGATLLLDGGRLLVS
jgi:NAD(P)-dependent dehydrogenase (short-subunit alcohol dehydrogenase family)